MPLQSRHDKKIPSTRFVTLPNQTKQMGLATANVAKLTELTEEEIEEL